MIPMETRRSMTFMLIASCVGGRLCAAPRFPRWDAAGHVRVICGGLLSCFLLLC